MTKEQLYSSFDSRYAELERALAGDSLEKIKELTLEVHAMVHPAEVSGRQGKTIADYVLEYMLAGNQNVPVPRQKWDTDLHYAGAKMVPLCWQFWHLYRIEDLVGNILMADREQLFNAEWQRKMGALITDTGNALEPGEAAAFGEKLHAGALRDYMIAVGKNTRGIIERLTLEEIRSMVPEEWVMKILEVGGVTTDFRSVWLLVFWGRLTRGGMILTPLTNHHMMHLPACLENLPIIQ